MGRSSQKVRRKWKSHKCGCALPRCRPIHGSEENHGPMNPSGVGPKDINWRCSETALLIWPSLNPQNQFYRETQLQPQRKLPEVNVATTRKNSPQNGAPQTRGCCGGLPCGPVKSCYPCPTVGACIGYSPFSGFYSPAAAVLVEEEGEGDVSPKLVAPFFLCFKSQFFLRSLILSRSIVSRRYSAGFGLSLWGRVLCSSVAVKAGMKQLPFSSPGHIFGEIVRSAV